MPSALLLTIRFHDGRYHGVPDWPPSPARVFQALVAAAARGARLPEDAAAALEWLEMQGAPVIAAPAAREAKGFTNYVPNNDLDAVGGDVKRIDKIRAGKTIRPRLFDAEAPLLYAWTFGETDAATSNAKTIGEIALDLYQLGRGVDMAWAVADILDADEADERLRSHPGAIYRPATGAAPAGGRALAVPMPGSLASLSARYNASATRFETLTKARKPTKKDPRTAEFAGQLFSQPPKARFAQVAYDCPATYLLFDISPKTAAWPFTQPSNLVELVRDIAAKRLSEALPDKKASIERIFIGGKDSSDADKAERIRIIPLPSIGHDHADHAIRRVLIEIPPNCQLPIGDIEWAFSGLDLSDIDPDTGEIKIDRLLVGAESHAMLKYYGADDNHSSRLWRTVTPAALPDAAKRRRIDPEKLKEEAVERRRDPHFKGVAKGGAERRSEIELAASAVCAALRHAGIAEPARSIRVQREPFEGRGARAEAFAPKTRFSKYRLWHAEIEFSKPLAGPLVIGDGRYLGLGLMAPLKDAHRDAFIFDIARENRPSAEKLTPFLRAARRALMALDRDFGGSGEVSRLFAGHEPDGAPARSGAHDHVFLAAHGDGMELSRLYVIAPHRADRRAKLQDSAKKRFDDVIDNLETVRAGQLGVFRLKKSTSDHANDPFLARSRHWISQTLYSPTRHGKSKDRIEPNLIEDVVGECARRGFPKPKVTINKFEVGPRAGVRATLQLEFQTAIEGPILIGKGAHFGLGLFRAVSDP